MNEDRKDPAGPGYSRLLAIGAPAIPAMIATFDQAVAHPRRHSVYTIERLVSVASAMRNDQSLLLLRKAVRTRQQEVVLAGATALCRNGGPAATEEFIRLFDPRKSHPLAKIDGQYRLQLLGELARRGVKTAINPLFQLLLRLSPNSDFTQKAVDRALVAELRTTIFKTIEKLTGQRMNEDPDRVRAWLKNAATKPSAASLNGNP